MKAPRSRIKRIARGNIGHPTLPPACWPKDRLSVSPRSERSRRKRDGRRMTYCLGIRVADGLVCLADGRTTSGNQVTRSEEHTSELQSLMRISYAVFCLKKQKSNPDKNKLKPLHQHEYTHDPIDNHTDTTTHTPNN